MDLSVFAKYKIKVIHNSSYITDRIGDEYYFSDSHNEYKKIVDGWELMQWLSKEMVGEYVVGVSVTQQDEHTSIVYIEEFNASNGECADITYEITPILKETKELKEIKEDV